MLLTLHLQCIRFEWHKGLRKEMCDSGACLLFSIIPYFCQIVICTMKCFTQSVLSR